MIYAVVFALMMLPAAIAVGRDTVVVTDQLGLYWWKR